MSRSLLLLSMALSGAIFLAVGDGESGGSVSAAAPTASQDDPAAEKSARAQAESPKPAHPAARQSKRQESARQSQGKRAQDKTAAPAVELRSGKEAVEEALAEKTALELVETPLQDVVDFLQQKHKILIQLDKKALDDIGVAAETPITKHLPNVSLRSALRLTLRDLDLTWIIADEVLLITTPEEANNRLTTEVYDVADLVTFRDEKNELWEDYDSLIEAITCALQPTTWDSVGGPGSIAPGTYGTARVLVVSQTQEVHEEIVVLLEKIRGVIRQSGEKKLEPPRRKQPPPQQGFMGGMGMGGMGGGEKKGAKSRKPGEKNGG